MMGRTHSIALRIVGRNFWAMDTVGERRFFTDHNDESRVDVGSLRFSPTHDTSAGYHVELPAGRFIAAYRLQCYFARPNASWQRGTNKSVNGLVRRYFPKGTNFSNITDEQVAKVELIFSHLSHLGLGLAHLFANTLTDKGLFPSAFRPLLSLPEPPQRPRNGC
jgi:hypothetical protein